MNEQNTHCFFVSDLHGCLTRWKKLFAQIIKEKPGLVFIGGDLLPSPLLALTKMEFRNDNFIYGFLVKELAYLKEVLGEDYPAIFVILGNDDGRMEEAAMLDVSAQGLWHYCHNRRINWGEYTVYGYAYIPPSPMRLKDWERYDVSCYVDPGCTAPCEGVHSICVSDYEVNYATITEDLEKLVGTDKLDRSIFLFHAPPYQSKLDRAALDGKMIDYVPLDVHIGSIGIARFIETHQPMLTLHGHVHESTRLTGSWQDRLAGTYAFNGAHDGPELSLLRFDLHKLGEANRELL